jgi:hypothetical protein
MGACGTPAEVVGLTFFYRTLNRKQVNTDSQISGGVGMMRWGGLA